MSAEYLKTYLFFFLIEKVHIKFSKDVLSSCLFCIFIINVFLFFSNSSTNLNKCHILRLFNSFIHCNILNLKLIFIILTVFISLHDHLFNDQFILNLKRQNMHCILNKNVSFIH